jgi:hypothetical protein
MKLTPVAAMRARDVSRPRDEHVTEAEAAEAAEEKFRKQAAAAGRRPSRSRRPGPGARAKPDA